MIMPKLGKKLGLLLPMKEGIYGGKTPSGDDVLAMARQCEAIGLDSVWLVDHFLHEPYADEKAFGHDFPEEWLGRKIGFWECWTMASAVSVATQSIEIGTLVTNTGYRNPALLAKMANTVDELSHGRLIFGVGAGDFTSEYHMYGYDWEKRVGKFEEALKIITPMLRGEEVSFQGEFYKTVNASVKPHGPNPKGPPVLIGMLDGGPRMSRLVTTYADHWNCWLVGGRDYDSCLSMIQKACEQHHREIDTLQKNAAIGIAMPHATACPPGVKPLSGSPYEIADRLATLLSKDVDHIVIWLHPMTPSGLDALEETLALLD